MPNWFVVLSGGDFDNTGQAVHFFDNREDAEERAVKYLTRHSEDVEIVEIAEVNRYRPAPKGIRGKWFRKVAKPWVVRKFTATGPRPV